MGTKIQLHVCNKLSVSSSNLSYIVHKIWIENRKQTTN